MAREQLFVASKVAAEHKTYEEAKAGIDKTLETMGLDYLDLMIIHSPQPWDKVNQSDDRYVEGNRAAWRALEDAYKAGKLKAIGISNFQLGTVSLPKTANPEHMKSNAAVDFEISDEDMKTLKNFKKIESYGESGIFPVYGGKM